MAYADLIVNEIMYAPVTGSDYEWVEIFNSGNSAIDLNNYRFFHGETNSGPLTLRNGTTSVLQPSAYAIITKSQTNYSWLNFSGMILSASTLSLPDSGDNIFIAISDPNKVIFDSIKYDPSLGGSKESGNSLSKINNVWIGAAPTPGAANETVSAPANSSNNDNSVSSNTSTAEIKTTTEEPKIKTKITALTLAFSGIPLSFEASAFGYNKESLYYGRYFWNFGDGSSEEAKLSDNKKFTHTYFYPGEYTVSLEYYLNPYSNIPDASDKITIKIIEADILISRVGDEKDFFVELSNNTSYDADISNWILASGAKSFSMPRNTTIGPKKKVIISSQITNFSIADRNTLKLMTPQGITVSDYSTSLTPVAKALPVIVATDRNTVKNETSERLLENIEVSQLQLPVENLAASTLSSESIQSDSFRTYILATLLTVLIGASAGAVYFIRQKKVVSKAGADFKILDE